MPMNQALSSLIPEPTAIHSKVSVFMVMFLANTLQEKVSLAQLMQTTISLQASPSKVI